MSGGIPYVPLDCQLDEKFDYIEAEFGLTGFAVVVKLFQRIYGGHGYYCEWNDRVALLFAHQIGAGVSAVREITSAAIRERIFDKGMYDRYGILTSRGIQRRFAAVAKRRKQIFDKPEYALLCCNQNSENADISGKNVCNSSGNVCNSGTSKVNGIKLNGSEGKESKAPAAPSSTKNKPVFSSDRAQLAEKYGESAISKYEEKYRKWCSSKGISGGDMYGTIAKWMAQDNVPAENKANSSFDVDDIMQSIIDGYKKE